jgi:hypothetical protein
VLTTATALPTKPTEIDGHLYWLVGDRVWPYVAGAADGDEGDGGGDGDGDEGDGEGDGDEEPTPEELKAEAEKWKKLARKHEDRAKANAKAKRDFDELQRKHATDEERVKLEARDEGKAEALKGLAPKLLAAEVKAAAGSRITAEAQATLLEGLDATKFLTDDGDVDTDKVTTLIEGIAGPKSDTDDQGGNGRFPDLGQGRRPSGKAAKADAGRAEAERRFAKKKTAS